MKILETKISSTLAVLSFCLVPGSAANAATAEDCANLAKLVAGNTTITSASLIPAGGALPEYCRVQGRVDTEIGFEVRLLYRQRQHRGCREFRLPAHFG